MATTATSTPFLLANFEERGREPVGPPVGVRLPFRIERLD